MTQEKGQEERRIWKKYRELLNEEEKAFLRAAQPQESNYCCEEARETSRKFEVSEYARTGCNRERYGNICTIFDTFFREIKQIFPSCSSARDILYQHEMRMPENRGERILRLVLCAIWGPIGAAWISLLIPILFEPLPRSPVVNAMFRILVMAAIVFLTYFVLIEGLIYGLAIKLTITNKKLLIRAPSWVYMRISGLYRLKIPISKIVGVSVYNPQSPELQNLLSGNPSRGYRFKFQPNWRLPSRCPYQYIFVLNVPPSAHHQYVDIKLRTGKHILIEFDDAENFFDILVGKLKEEV